MRHDLTDRVALVTGAGSGIGEAAALAFAADGAAIVVADCDDETGQETVDRIAASGGEALFVHADVSQAEDVAALFKQVTATYCRLDFAFNNAGMGGAPAPLADGDEANWDQVIAVNLKGTWLCMKHEIAQFLAQGGGGAIVNCSSAAGLIGVENMAPYTASKHGIIGLTKAAALDYAEDGIRVNTVCLGPIRTPPFAAMLEDPALLSSITSQLPLGRLGEPHEVAAAVVWLCSDQASFITGATLPVDGGWVAR